MATLRFGIFLAAVLIAAGPVRAQWHDWQRESPGAFRLASGRVFYALIDRRTDDHTLWLRFAWDRTVILRPIAWDRVVEATWEDRTFTGPQLREWLSRPLPPAPVDPVPADPVPPPIPQPTLEQAGRAAAIGVAGIFAMGQFW